MPVEIREESLELPTYVWGPPDPNPPFQRRGRDRIYPYPLLDDPGEEARPVSYRALVVENEYRVFLSYFLPFSFIGTIEECCEHKIS